MHDIHIHTSLSRCAKPDSDPAGYFEEIPRRGLTVAGFANHLWDSAVPGASEWYRPQDIAHLLPLKEKLAATTIPGVRLLFGCETEYIGNKTVGLLPENAELFDFVLVPPHHFHMTGFVRPAEITGGEALTKLFVTRFLEACEIDFAFGFVHPFVPLGFLDRAHEVLANIPDRLLEECFQSAAEHGKSIEINLSIFSDLSPEALIEYERVMITARQCGCRFHIGSDAHGLIEFGADRFIKGENFAKRCGVELAEDPFAKKSGK